MYGIYENGTVIAQFVTPMSVRSNHPVYVSDTLSLNRQINQRTAQRWEIETRVEPLSSSAQDLFVSLVTKGYSETVTIVTPQNYGAVQALTASSAITATGTVNSVAVAITGNNGIIPKGTFIRFSGTGGHSKVYLVTANRSGDGNMDIYPALRETISSVTISYKNDVYMSCLYDLDVISGMVYTDGILMDPGTIRLIERLA